MIAPQPPDRSGRMSPEITKAAYQWRFFQNFMWAATEDRETEPACPACRTFPDDGSHGPEYMVHELETRLVANMTAEMEEGEKIADLEEIVSGFQEERDKLVKELAVL